MNVADRHLGFSAVAGIGLALLALMALDTVFTLIAELGDVGRGDYSVTHALQYVLLTLPQRAVNLFPTAVVVGTLLGVGGLAAGNEIVAYRTAGMSRLRISMAVVLSGAALLVPMILVAEWVAPAGERMGHAMRLRAQSADVGLGSDAALWVRDGDRIVHARRPVASESGIARALELADIDVFEFSEGRLMRATHAASGQFHDGQWTLTGLKRSVLEADRVQALELDAEQWPSLLSPDQIRAAVAHPQSLSVSELAPHVNYLLANGLDARAYRAALWSKLTFPLTTLVIMFAAMPFVFYGLRAGGLGIRLFVGMLLGIGFYFANRSAGSLGQVYDLHPALAATAPSLLFVAVTLWLLRRQV